MKYTKDGIEYDDNYAELRHFDIDPDKSKVNSVTLATMWDDLAREAEYNSSPAGRWRSFVSDTLPILLILAVGVIIIIKSII